MKHPFYRRAEEVMLKQETNTSKFAKAYENSSVYKVAYPTVRSYWQKQDELPNIDIFLAFCEHTGASPDYMAFGKGAPPLDPKLQEIVTRYEQATDKQKKLVDSLLDSFSDLVRDVN